MREPIQHPDFVERVLASDDPAAGDVRDTARYVLDHLVRLTRATEAVAERGEREDMARS